jgi:ABC-type transport system involved in multi-copper enzyme maturation permease subunit
MKMNSRNFFAIIRFTIQDELHNKSFYVLTAVSMLFVLLIKGCFNSNVVVNGQHVDSTTVGYNASIIAFNIIASAGVLMAILLSMRVLKRDIDNGMASMIFSKPVKRIEYITGKIGGIWVLAYGLTLLLHITVYLIMLFNTGGRIPFFIPASQITSLNILFAIVIVMLFSMVMPDFIAALTTIGIAVVSLGVDSFYAVSQNAAVQSFIGQQDSHIPLWRILWPKLVSLQFFATSIIKESTFQQIGPLNPIFNIALYSVLFFGILFWKISREELQ